MHDGTGQRMNISSRGEAAGEFFVRKRPLP
jgi:hypothetical protein